MITRSAQQRTGTGADKCLSRPKLEENTDVEEKLRTECISCARKLCKANCWRVSTEDSVHIFLRLLVRRNPVMSTSDGKKRTRNESPMIHAGTPGCGAMKPVRSKIAPRHWPLLIVPTLRSTTLIGQAGPPKASEMDSWVAHAASGFIESALCCVRSRAPSKVRRKTHGRSNSQSGSQ
jgi:hypothetical protein